MKNEHEHGKKLDALFDGYTQLYEVSSETRRDVREIKRKVDKHEAGFVALGLDTAK